ncbi:RusA family crossover junction endodeoxyribonuclease [Corynebacterium phocae]|nr:RusA family crossover junction endodeoxyribonuclease [Corynebacterium phocae]
MTTSPVVELDIFVPGVPRPQGSKRHIGGGRMVESSKYVKSWRQAVALKARHYRKRQPPLTGPLWLRVEFIMPARKREPDPGGWHIVKPDVDKLLRAICDAVTDIVIADDCLLVDVHVRKRRARLSEKPGARIIITRATETP